MLVPCHISIVRLRVFRSDRRLVDFEAAYRVVRNAKLISLWSFLGGLSPLYLRVAALGAVCTVLSVATDYGGNDKIKSTFSPTFDKVVIYTALVVQETTMVDRLQGKIFSLVQPAERNIDEVYAEALAELLDLAPYNKDGSIDAYLVWLPDGSDDYVFIGRLRASSPRIAVALKSAPSKEQVVSLLDAGYDDVVPTESGPAELLLRLALLFQIEERAISHARQRRQIRLDSRLKDAFVESRAAGLTPVEFRLVSYLARRNRQVVSRADLFRRIWGGRNPGSRRVDLHASRARKKLSLLSGRCVIRSVYGSGYVWQS
jgi:DNA-binding response OmpR family regulator